MKRVGPCGGWLGAAMSGLIIAGMFRPAAAADRSRSVEDDEVVSLPPLLVEEKERPLHWRYLDAGAFEMLSIVDDAVTREFARRCRRLDQVLTLLVPERFQFHTAVPRTQILFNEDLGRARSQEVMNEMLRRDGLKAPPTSGPIRLPDLPRPGGGLAPWQRARVYFLPNLRLTDIDAEAVFAATNESDTEQLQFTYVVDRIAFLLERRVPALPEWFIQGTVGLYERCRLGTDGIEFDPAEWLSEPETRAILLDEDHPRTLLPMAELLAHRRPGSEKDDDDLTRIWRAQCALFVRWAMLENGGARRDGLWSLVDRLEEEPLTEGLFRQCLGFGFADMRDVLSDYLPEAVRQRESMKAPKLDVLPDLKPRTATTVEIARIRGDWERMELNYVGRRWPGVVEKYVEQARRTLQVAYREGARDPELLAIIGLTEYDAGNAEGGRAYLEAAAHAGVWRPRIYVELAKERFETGLAQAGNGKLSALQVRRILEPLEVVRGMEPRMAAVYAIMAEVWSRSAEPPTADELEVLTDGLRSFPRLAPLLYRGIYLNAKHGHDQAAGELARLGLRHATDEEARERFKQLSAQLAPSLRREQGRLAP